MAISREEKSKWKPFRSKYPYFTSHDLPNKLLKVDFKSLRPIARRAILSLKRRESYHPHSINYLYFINLTILNDKVFHNLNLCFIFNYKKKEEGYT